MQNTDEKTSLLLVDDDASNLMELVHILRSEYTVHSVKSGDAALKQMEKSLPELILLDINMPEMSGFEVLTELKKSDKYKDIPVIFITTTSEYSNEGKGLYLGAVDYIRKPFDPMVVRLRVRNQVKVINLKMELETCKKELEAIRKGA